MVKSKYVVLAERTIETYIKTGLNQSTNLKEFNQLREDNDLKAKKACFVSIHLKNNQLRGCIGTLYPYRESLFDEIVHNAISASTEDPRFSPITEKELDKLLINVDVLSEPLLIKDINELDCKKYGVIVSNGYQKGVLLPDLEGVDSVDYQLEIAKNKAGIRADNNDIDIYKFTVDRYY